MPAVVFENGEGVVFFAVGEIISAKEIRVFIE